MKPCNNIIIRDAQKEDVNDLTRLMCDLGYETTVGAMVTRFYNINNHSDYKTLVAVHDNIIAGMIGLHKNYYYENDGMYVRILALVTDKQSRKNGIGSELMEAALNWALKIGATAIMLNSGNREERKIAHLFYEKMGFQIKSFGFVKKIK